MPRDSNGNYTLPSGNPVVSGEVISTSWANPTLSDVAAEMTNSLDRSGRGGMLAPFKFLDGTAGAPGMSWTSEPTTGFYRAALSDMRATVAGVGRMRWTGVGCDVWDTAANAGAGAWFSLSGAAGLNIPLLNVNNAFTAGQRIVGSGFGLVFDNTLVTTFSGRVGIGMFGADTVDFSMYTASSWYPIVLASATTTDFRGDTLRFSTLGGTEIAQFNNAGLSLRAGRKLSLYDATDTSARDLKIGASNEIVVDTRGGMQHWSSSALTFGQINISTTAPAASGGSPGVMTLVYE
jgi:hypothetical protein